MESSQRTEVRIDLYSDEEGLYDVTVTLPDGSRLIVDPRNVYQHLDGATATVTTVTAAS